MAAENDPNSQDSPADANTQLTMTTNLPDTLCPGEPIEVCANLSQRCGGDNLVPLPGRSLIFFANAGDCGANVGQAGEDTVLTDPQGNACFVVTVSGDTGLFAIRIKFQGEDKPYPCPEIGNNGCSPADPVANKRCINLSATNTCIVYIVDSNSCGCGEPVINCPAYVTQANDAGQCGARVGFDVQASGRCEPITISCIPPAGSFFLVGTTLVTCMATDTAGNSSQCSFPVTVQDTEAPQAFCPENIKVTTGPGQTNVPVAYSASAVDNCASAPVVCTPPSGSLFPIGVTAVSCTTADASQNSAGCSFTVTVNSILFFQRSGNFSGDQLGFSVAAGGDLNGDGFTDFLIGIPGADGGGSGNSAALLDVGSVEVFSGVDGSLLYQVDGTAGADRLGGSLGLTTGDVDGDGTDDFIAGAPDADVNGMADAGVVNVYSGDDGLLLYQIQGSAADDRLGGSVGILDDINSDEHDEFVVGVPGKDIGGTGNSAAFPDAGAVYVYSGMDGNLLYAINGTAVGDRLGGSLGFEGEVSGGDEEENFIVGAPGTDVNGMVDAGAAYVYSGANGQLIYQIKGTSAGDRLGGSVGFVGDVDGSSEEEDFMVGAPYKDVVTLGTAATLIDAGAAYVFSGKDGSLLYEITGTGSGDRLGGTVGASQDVDGNGSDDFYAGAPGADPNGLVDAGTVTIYSGQNGLPLFRADGAAAGDQLGSSAAMFQTTDGGVVRFLIGAPNVDAGGELDAGSAYVYQIVFKGDLNGDGRLTTADLVLLLNCIFLEAGYCPATSADLNCDGSLVSPTDVVILLNSIFLGQPITCVQ